jgi:hypothetical protein
MVFLPFSSVAQPRGEIMLTCLHSESKAQTAILTIQACLRRLFSHLRAARAGGGALQKPQRCRDNAAKPA